MHSIYTTIRNTARCTISCQLPMCDLVYLTSMLYLYKNTLIWRFLDTNCKLCFKKKSSHFVWQLAPVVFPTHFLLSACYQTLWTLAVLHSFSSPIRAVSIWIAENRWSQVRYERTAVKYIVVESLYWWASGLLHGQPDTKRVKRSRKHFCGLFFSIRARLKHPKGGWERRGLVYTGACSWVRAKEKQICFSAL